MILDRGSFSCFSRHSTDAAPFLYEVLRNANIYEVLGYANLQPAKKSGLGKLWGICIVPWIKKFNFSDNPSTMSKLFVLLHHGTE